MANVISIRIEADGTAAIVGMNGVADAGKKMSQNHSQSMAAMSTSTVAATTAITAAVATATATIAAAANTSIQYLATLETANLGIASAFMTAGKYSDETTGKVLQGEAALKAAQVDAVAVMDQLKVENMQTIATLDQLVRAYQETLPVAMAKGFNRDQVLSYTTAMVQAAGAIGLSMHQLGEETRSMLTGAIDPRTSRIATVLGLRNEDIAKYKGDAQGLFDFLMNKLEAYQVAGIESQKTWAGLMSNSKDLLLLMGGEAFTPLFEAVKYELTAITGSLVSIDEKTKKISWNPEFLDTIDKIKGGVTSVIAEVYRFNGLLDKLGGSKAWVDMFGSGLGSAMNISRKKNPILSFLFGSTEEFEEAAQRNLDYEQRYLNTVKSLQALANREMGLDANGNPLKGGKSSPWGQNALGADEKAAEKARKAAEQYQTAIAGIKNEIAMANPYLDEHSKALLKIDQRFEGLMKQYAKLPGATAALKDYRDELKKLADDEETRKLTLAQNERLAEEIGFAMAQGDFTSAKYKQRLQYTFQKPTYSLIGNEKNTGFNQPAMNDLHLDQQMQRLNGDLALSGINRYDAQKTAIQAEYDDRLALAQKFYAARVGMEAEYAAKVEQINADHSKKLRAVEMDRWTATIGIVADSMGQIAQQMMQGNKGQFEDGKKMAMATATIQGALAIVQAYGQLGYIAGTVAAVAIGAITAANIAKIDSQQYQATRALGGSVMAGGRYLVGERGPEIFTADRNGTITPNDRISGRSQTVQVTNVYQMSTGVSATVQAEIIRLAPMFQQMAVSSVRQAMRNGEFQEAY